MKDLIEIKKKKIDEQIEKNLIRKKMLLIQEKKKRQMKFSEIGKLAYQANIDQIDKEVLLGAFIEIAKNINEEKLKEWKDNVNQLKKNQTTNDQQLYSLSFLEEISTEIKRKLKENGFVWNRFRKEYYGKSSSQKIKGFLENIKVNIEILES